MYYQALTYLRLEAVNMCVCNSEKIAMHSSR